MDEASEQAQLSDEVNVPIQAIQIIDPEVVARLPPGTNAVRIEAHGASFWTRTARLETERDGVKGAVFLKTTYGERGRDLLSSEYHCMGKLHAAAPDPYLVPRPIAWGSYSSIPDVHFFLSEFRPMTGGLPDLGIFPAKIAAMHRGTSTSKCPPDSGRFGFDATTFHGEIPIEHGWSDTWEEYFARTTRALLRLEQEARGPSEEVRQLTEPFFEKVVPRLLRPLHTGGRSIRPSLIHGDLWHGNASTDRDTGMPVIFDAASFYAHNEYELAVWRQPWNEINKPYRERYHEHFPKSPPEADYDDRGLLYATRVNILDSILYRKDPSYREMLLAGMRELVEKFPDGLEE
ncbi:hypothetical protein SLS62_007171 [Diatrype stigma]|uniref:protein-ribulosamine 3-kinase n=1 Tax=Diatrype stigma TaxID=117547 RepID=A0AAN9UZV8_9PEZI